MLEDETVEISGNRFIINFAEELSGGKNRVKIAAGALQEEDGKVLGQEIITERFEARVVDECFIATAAYGSKLDPGVVVLREFRDARLLTSRPGRAFVSFYYSISPGIAEQIAKYNILKEITKVFLLPVIVLAYLYLHLPLMLAVAITVIPVMYLWKRRRVMAWK